MRLWHLDGEVVLGPREEPRKREKGQDTTHKCPCHSLPGVKYSGGSTSAESYK